MVANFRRLPNFLRFPKPSSSPSDKVRVMEEDEPDVGLTGAMIALALTCVGLKLLVFLCAESLPHVFGS
ncbi:MAG: hypothetical protein Q7R85_03130 [bacterium]|nr:hypothetical protein [bacterium]